MSTGRYEVVGRLPPGQGGKTSLALMGGAQAFRRLAVLRPVGDATLIPVASLHPQLPSPLGVDEIEGVSCAIYDFFPGATLHEIVQVYRAQEQLPPLGLAARIVIDAARIIVLAHEHQDPLGGAGGFVHGGIADTSLLLGFDGEVRVLDFGLRKMNRFASPEAARGAPCTPKSDVFSLAAALHASLTGFDRDYALVLSKAPSSSQFPPPSTVHPDATQQLDSLLMRALMPDEGSRLASATELADDLERIVGEGLPQPQSVASRLKQLFEERLDGFRNMVPKLSSDAPPATTPPKPRTSTSAPKLPTSRASAPQPPRKSGPRSPIPTGTQPEANPVGRRKTPDEVKAAFGDPAGDNDLADESTIVASDLELKKIPRSTGEQKKLDATKTKVEGTRNDRSPLERKTSGSKKQLPPLPDVPWENGPLRAGVVTDPQGGDGQPTQAQGGPVVPPDDTDSVPIEDVPTGQSKRVSGAHAALGGSSREEKVRAKGQELVDTGEFEIPETDDLRDQPTVVKVSGTHQKLAVEPPPDEVAAAFGDPAGADEPGTAVIGDRAAGGPPVLHPVEPGIQPGAPSPIDAPDTGVLAQGRPEPAAGAKKTKKKSSGARKLIAFLLIAMAGGIGYAKVKHPAVFKAKLELAVAKGNALAVKYGLKKPEPPPPPPPEEPVAGVAETDGGEPELVAPGPVLADADGGLDAREGDGGEEEEEEEDDDAGVFAGDAGHASDGGHAVKKKKKKKKKNRKEWWKTQQ